jgi:cell division protein FtsL
MELLSILLQAEAQGVNIFVLFFTLLLVICLVFYCFEKHMFVSKQEKIDKLKKQIAEKEANEHNKAFKIKDDGTIVRVDETYSDNNDMTYCPHCGKKLK